MAAPDAIDAARLEAAQMEWERHERERRVLVGRVNLAYQELVATIGLLDGMRGALAGMREHLEAGDWIKSPKAMAAARAKTCQEERIPTEHHRTGTVPGQIPTQSHTKDGAR